MSAAPVDCRLQPCDVHATLVLLVAGGAGVAATVSRLPLVLCAALWLTLLLLAWRELCEHAWRDGRRAARRLRADAHGWWLYASHGEVFGPATPVAGRIWTSGLVLILRDAAGARRRLLVGPGALRGDALRRLRVHALADLQGGSG